MTSVQRLRNNMAEKGYEMTVEETAPIMATASELLESVSYESYLWYKTLDEGDIRQLAARIGITFEDAQDAVDIVLHVGRIKYEGGE